MKILLLTNEGDGLALGLQFMREGHACAAWAKEPLGDLYKGIIEPRFYGIDSNDKPWHDIQAAIQWQPDYAIADVTGLSWAAQQCRTAGIPVLGGDSLNDALEQDRFEALRFADACGVHIPHTLGYSEHEVSKACEFIRDCGPDEHYVVKSSRHDKASSFVATNPEDIEPFMTEFPPQGPFILQERIDGLCEVNVECWFSNGLPIGLVVGGMEQKKFLTGDKKHPKGLGSNTGCMSNLGWVWQRGLDHPLVKKAFTPGLLVALERLRYNGPLDMALLIGKDHEAYFIEFTPRFGYDAIYDMMEYVETDWGKFFQALALGKLPKFNPKPGFGCSIDISITPYPQDNPRVLFKGEPVRLDAGMKGHYWPGDVMVRDGRLISAGVSGWLGAVTGYGLDWQEAVETSMRYVHSLEISDLQYRSDAGSQGIGIDELRKLGFIVP